MASWTTKTKAIKNVEQSLKSVDGVLGFMSDSPGKPSSGERALYAAAVVFIYGIWENYCEQLAIELGARVATDVAPKDVPEKMRKSLEKHSAWELSVHPGWRKMWIDKVTTTAIGDDGEKFGLNTAKAGQVSHLLELIGVNKPFEGFPANVIPPHLSMKCKEVSEAVNALVELRGEIVHTGAVPASLRKTHVREWREFLGNITAELDRQCRKQCKDLL